MTTRVFDSEAFEDTLDATAPRRSFLVGYLAPGETMDSVKPDVWTTILSPLPGFGPGAVINRMSADGLTVIFMTPVPLFAAHRRGA